jgi:serine/threonine protein kinase
VPGGDFFTHVESGAFEVSVVLKYALQLLNAVSALHDAGVAHLDIALENLVRQADDELCLVDFDHAVFTHNSETGSELRHHRLCGKHSYRPPECWQTSEHGYLARSVDVYECGIVLLTMLLGHFPWEAARQSDAAYVWANKHGLHAMFTGWGYHHVPEKLLVFLETLVARDPRDRPSAQTAFQELQKVIQVCEEGSKSQDLSSEGL